jgi:hypothetical protein
MAWQPVWCVDWGLRLTELTERELTERELTERELTERELSEDQLTEHEMGLHTCAGARGSDVFGTARPTGGPT